MSANKPGGNRRFSVLANDRVRLAAERLVPAADRDETAAGRRLHDAGYALEYPISRGLCDARILNIFEGAAEIQAQIIARGLVAGRN